MKVIIMAGGKQKRYEPSTPKQLIKIDGETLIERQITQFRSFGEVTVIADKPEFDFINDINDIKLKKPSENTHELSKFMSSYDLWKDADGVIFVYGDSYITDTGIEIINKMKDSDFCFFGTNNEMLALKVSRNYYEKFVAGINYIKILQDRDEGGLCGSWTLYRLLLGKDLIASIWYDHFCFIADESDDFDSEAQLQTWLEKYPTHTGSIS